MNFKHIIESRFAKLYGLPCWQVESGQGSILTMEFGKPHLVVREPMKTQKGSSPKIKGILARRTVRARGEWFLWVYCADWILRDKTGHVGDSSSKISIQRAIQVLDGQKLVGMKLSPRNSKTLFKFDLGGVLEVSPYDRESELWSLHEPGGKVLTYRADNCYFYGKGDSLAKPNEWCEVT